jgi:hypothetical protein
MLSEKRVEHEILPLVMSPASADEKAGDSGAAIVKEITQWAIL